MMKNVLISINVSTKVFIKLDFKKLYTLPTCSYFLSKDFRPLQSGHLIVVLKPFTQVLISSCVIAAPTLDFLRVKSDNCKVPDTYLFNKC